MEKINWSKISKDRNDKECLNCHSCSGGKILGYRELDDDFGQRAHICANCQNIVITIYEEYNVQCRFCSDGWIKNQI